MSPGLGGVTGHWRRKQVEIVSESSPAFPGNGAALEPSPWPLAWVEMLLPAGPGSGARLTAVWGPGGAGR